MNRKITGRLPEDEFQDVRRAVEVLKEGGILIYPTDTVWGIGCDATNPEAVARLYQIKKRADNKPMLALVDSEDMLFRFIDNIPEVAFDLIEAAVNPLTIIYDNPRGLAPSLFGEDGSMGIRITSDPFSAAICRGLRRPVVSTSANFAGQKPAKDFDDIDRDLLDKADYVCRSRRDIKSDAAPSGIIKLSEGGLFKIIR